MLVDNHKRIHDYLRISLTDSCNFRCQYCMPDENIQCLPNKHLMQVDEIEKIATNFVNLGVNKIRLTGGEPLVRKEFREILSRLSKLPVEISLTTNAVLVHKFIDDFKAAGIRAVNVSLDTLDAETFKRITKRDQFDLVWRNIQLLLKEGFRVKINAVAIEGVIEKEILDFVEITRDLPLHVRMIEFMPFEGNHWNSKKVITATQMLKWAEAEYDMVKLKDKPHATAKKYKAIGHEGTFAFITTMTEHFCGDCNRMRITADGKMKNCLFGKDEMDLLGTLRKGEDIEPLIRLSVLKKHAVMGGQFNKSYKDTETTQLENRSMIRIGG
ncbi:cyclic pyranopterin phosphate synthase MoaA [Salegentibacter salinarum]|uniref:GTP 3',8-cyclase n=1 Tax=Salegentibacter salinarum TaxID=447422 RepID=A0A2N0TXG6_9FLAO|nr:GTP 3',8-cyclase MoaA [Salegentibacter salinarum]PKD19440.1 cyclic pyranopterin phosphate synthase MoaA [Salegentibacter salinarum]SKB92201.1 cyclic pyranopterin phosphate synthase [Salegentibacter salinarum]